MVYLYSVTIHPYNKNWRLSLSHLPAAMRLFGIRLSRDREWTNYLHGIATWEDAGGGGME